jgi:LmbE family N-acetylglucosaminyl deacetylase
MGHSRDLLERFCLARKGASVPRVMVVAAHPDDDILGAGGRLPGLSQNLYVVYVSDGAPRNPRFAREAGFPDRESYALARRSEAREALGIAGVGDDRIFELSAIDQETTLELPRLTREMAALMRSIEPEIVLSHPYEGGHPDHDATALVVHAARQLLLEAGDAVPTLFEFTSCHERRGELSFGQFLAQAGLEDRVFELGDELSEQKARMLACHRTQASLWSRLPLRFERFRVAPEYDFLRAPEGRFAYDRVDRGVSGACFLAFASAALALLGIEGTC